MLHYITNTFDVFNFLDSFHNRVLKSLESAGEGAVYGPWQCPRTKVEWGNYTPT